MIIILKCIRYITKENLLPLKDLSEHKNKIYKYMTSISKNEYIKKIDDIVNECNKTYHRTIKMKPVDVEDNTYINSMVFHSNDKDPKFKVNGQVTISKGYTANWSDEVFVIKKVKNTVSQTYVINNLDGDEIIGTFYEKELQKTNQQQFRIAKVTIRKGDKLYVKWKGDSSLIARLIKKT